MRSKQGAWTTCCRRSLPILKPLAWTRTQAPVRPCHRYLSARRNQLNYREALANDLPIGSGEIESAHRYIAQQRLKRPGAWWRVEHADHMLALRINRRNGQWEAYWATFDKNVSLAANENRPATSRKSAA